MSPFQGCLQAVPFIYNHVSPSGLRVGSMVGYNNTLTRVTVRHEAVTREGVRILIGLICQTLCNSVVYLSVFRETASYLAVTSLLLLTNPPTLLAVVLPVLFWESYLL